MSAILIHGLRGLLADISRLTGVVLDAPDDLGMDWCLKEGPELDKQLLDFLEGRGEIPRWPEWLIPLWSHYITSSDATIIKYIRQLLVFGYKLELEPTNEHIREAQSSFEEVDSNIGIWDAYFDTHLEEPLFRTTRAIISRVIAKIDWQLVIPGHGPGSVYPSSEPSSKGNFNTIHANLDQHYPFYEYLAGMPAMWPNAYEARESGLSEAEYTYTRLVAVPKDSRGPRLICVHPQELIWIQQGQRKLLERAIERSAAGPYIKFKDQTVNGSLALASSIDREYCTLDLKDASDRMSNQLIRYLFGSAYHWMASSRAQIVKLFDGRFMRLRKFAPMGNCLTFPLQSLVFWALVQAGIRCRYGEGHCKTYVFGDDILFPSKYYDGAVNALTRAGFVTNTRKTFTHGFFRESCGVDAFNGKDVTPHRMKKHDMSSVTTLVGLCSLAKNLRIDGYEDTSAIIYSHVRHSGQELSLTNNPDCQGVCEYVDRNLGFIIRNNRSTRVRYNRGLQRWEVKVLLVKGTNTVLLTHDWYHVQDALVKLMQPCIINTEQRNASSLTHRDMHRERSENWSFSSEVVYPIPSGVRAQWGWTPVITTGEDVCLAEIIYRLTSSV